MRALPLLSEGNLKAAPVEGNPLEQKLNLWDPPNSTVPIKSYHVEMTKQFHVVVVSSDFKTFMHIHTSLSPMGHFITTQKFPAAGLSQVYADGLPNNINHQVFRFGTSIGKTCRVHDACFC